MQRSQVLPPPTTPQSARLHLINILRLTTLSLVSNGEVMKRVAAIKTALVCAHRQSTLTSPFFTLSPYGRSEGLTNLTEHSCAPSYQRESARTDAVQSGVTGMIASGTVVGTVTVEPLPVQSAWLHIPCAYIMHGGVVDVATGTIGPSGVTSSCTGVPLPVEYRYRYRWSYRLPIFCVAGTICLLVPP